MKCLSGKWLTSTVTPLKDVTALLTPVVKPRHFRVDIQELLVPNQVHFMILSLAVLKVYDVYKSVKFNQKPSISLRWSVPSPSES